MQNDTITKAYSTPLSKGSLERVKLIRLIFDFLILAGEPNERHDPLWYGHKFDELYEKEVGELRIALTVYAKSRGKPHI